MDSIFFRTGLEVLAARKRRLIADNVRLRAEIAEDLDTIERSLSWVDIGMRSGQFFKKNSLILSAVSGLFMAWKLFKDWGKTEAEKEDKPSLLGTLLNNGVRLAGLIGSGISLFRQVAGAAFSKKRLIGLG